jgi:hypothetical protein
VATEKAKRPPRGLHVTGPILQRATNEQILDAFGEIGDEVVRRIRNYGENATTPRALLNGITFAGRASAIQVEFSHGYKNWPYDLHNAVSELTKMMAGPWEESEPLFDDRDDDDA